MTTTAVKHRLTGGYVTLQTRAIKEQVNAHTLALDRPAGPAVLAAVNHIQKTRWAVNPRVLAVLEQCVAEGIALAGLPSPHDIPLPERLGEQAFEALDESARRELLREIEGIHSANNARRGHREQTFRRLEHARELVQHEALFYPHFLDFRGRVYPLPQDLNPQGDSLSKGLLCFAEGILLGDRGYDWLCIAFANAFGQDKISLEARCDWTLSQIEAIKATHADPLSMIQWWGGEECDSPWEALALALELGDIEADVTLGYEPQDRMSRTPVRLDATCSGIQHLAALMRDEESGHAVNLKDTGKREDIYGEVAKVAAERISIDAADGDVLAMQWAGRISRKTVKRAVMTTPYGVTERGIASQLIIDRFADHIEGALRYKAADYLRDVIVEALEVRIGAPRAAMAFFQAVAVALAEHDKPLIWTTPAGMTIRQGYFESDQREAITLMGRIRYVQENVDAGLVGRKQALASAPHVIHSFDAAHLMLTALACKDAGIRDLAFVHDSFGAHAGNVDTLSRLLREEFVKLYDAPQLARWLASVSEHSGIPLSELPEVPDLGKLDVSSVLASPFFFS